MEEEDVESANSAEEEDEEMLRSSKAQRIRSQTQWVITSFTAMLFVHACICEGPAAVLECAIRASTCLGYGMLCCVAGVVMCSASALKSGIRSLKEAVVVLAAMLSLLVPGCSLLPYRSFRPEENWDVEPIPTIVGWVDVRRLCVFAFGQAEMADNIHELHGAQDSCGESMWCFPRQWLARQHAHVPTSAEEAEEIELTDMKTA